MKVRPDDLLTFKDSALRKFETFTGTKIVVVEGCGLSGHGVCREVTYWFDEHGILIRRVDPSSDLVRPFEPEDGFGI